MAERYYKGYWMVTNRCNLSCSYCVLENSPEQLKKELSLQDKKDLITHLYQKLGFRRLTLSGGEALIIGKNPPADFIELLQHIRNFKSSISNKNLEIELYTNGTYLNQYVIDEMQGIVDVAAITVDSFNNELLGEIGRKFRGMNSYYEHVVKICNMLSKNSIAVKLHSVITNKNHLLLPKEVNSILHSIVYAGGNIAFWKFYQYMSYDVPELDKNNAIATGEYNAFKENMQLAIGDSKVKLHFKDNKEMHASLFNILSYGNAQYMRANDTWATSRRTKNLRQYNSMSELFAQHDINEELFNSFHGVYR